MGAIIDMLQRGAFEEMSFQFAPQVLLYSAIELGVFPAMAAGNKSVSRVAMATGCSQRGTRVLLDCMAALGLLEKEDERYELNSYSRRFLLPSGEEYVGPMFAPWEQLLRLWLSLPAAVRTGRPTLPLLTDEEREKLNLDTVEALFRLHKSSAWRLADLFDSQITLCQGARAAIKILDMAAGSAVWSIPFALKSRSVEVTAVDWIPVLEIARRHAREFGVESQYLFIGEDIRKVEFREPEYDWALLAHICHSEGAAWSRRLIENCFRALRENGTLLIMEYLRDEESKHDLMPLILAANALLGTDEGDTFTFSQYERWLLDAGFSEARMIRIEGHYPVISALKA